MGACRTNQLYSMKVTNIEDLKKAYLVTVPITKTKITRKFTVTGEFYQFITLFTNISIFDLQTYKMTLFLLIFKGENVQLKELDLTKLPKWDKRLRNFWTCQKPRHILDTASGDRVPSYLSMRMQTSQRWKGTEVGSQPLWLKNALILP